MANAQNSSCGGLVKREAEALYNPNPDSADLPICSQETDKYLTRDFSNLLIPSSEFIGFIGDNYQRLFIDFNSVTQDKNNKKIYRVTGSSKVKDNKTSFVGEIEVIEISVVAPHYEIDDRFKNDGIKAQGILFAKYDFREDKSVKFSGRFFGSLILRWLVDKNNELQYDVLDGDGSKNNQYSGKWTSYKTKATKIANWGEFRIPDSGDLDQSADGFWPNEKYAAQGWAEYKSPEVIVSKKNQLVRKGFNAD